MEEKKGTVRELNADDFANHAVKRGPSFRSLDSKEQFENARTEAAAKREAQAVTAENTEAGSGRPSRRKKFALSEIDTSFLLPARDEKLRPAREDLFGQINWVIVFSVALLCLFGIVMVASSSYYYAYTYMGDSLYFLRKQLMWILFGTVCLVVAAALPLTLIKKLSLVAYAVSVLFCVLVLFYGETVNGSTRWLTIAGITFQPAEVAKLGVAIYVSVLMEQYQSKVKNGWTFFAILLVVALPAGLVAKENLTSGLIIAAIGVVIMFIGGCRFKHFLVFLVPILLGILVLVVLPIILNRTYGDEWTSVLPGVFRKFYESYIYRTERIVSWMNPWKVATSGGYQTVQALYAVGSGGFLGRGLGNSLQKLGFIPEAHNDIIFAVICEELGVFGAAIVVVLFSILTFEGVRVAANSQDRFGGYLAAGITAQIGLQAILNMSVNLNVIPTTGVSLPFISYGGTSLAFLMVSVGLLLNVSRRAVRR